MTSGSNGERISRQVLYKAVAEIIVKYARERERMLLPMRINGHSVDEKTVVEAAAAHWREIAQALGIRVFSDPIAIDAVDKIRGGWLVRVHLPYGYRLLIEVGDDTTPKAWIEAPEMTAECYCGE